MRKKKKTNVEEIIILWTVTELILLLMQLFWHKVNSYILRDIMSIESYQVKNKEICNYAFGPKNTKIFKFFTCLSFPIFPAEKKKCKLFFSTMKRTCGGIIVSFSVKIFIQFILCLLLYFKYYLERDQF